MSSGGGSGGSSLSDLLIYLGEIGYGELYLGRGGPNEPAASEPAAGGPAGGDPPSSSSSPPPSPSPPAADAPERARRLAELAAAAAGCTRCRLAEGRRKVVFGAGDPDADLMFIGEGPGAEEDRQGLPFVGPAGQLLTRIIEAMGLTRDQVYIANVVKCRPPGNRDPQPDEAQACREYLDGQIDLVRPRVIVALGRVAAQSLLGNELALGRMRGQWYKVRGVDTLVTYHPAALLRNAALKRPTWEDVQKVMARLREPG